MACLLINISDETKRLEISISKVCSVNHEILEFLPLLVEEGYLYVTQSDGNILYLGVEK